MAEKKTIDRVVLDMKGYEEVQLYPSQSGQPSPDSVGTEQIKNDAVMMEDLNRSVKDKMMTDADRVTQEELDNFDV